MTADRTLAKRPIASRNWWLRQLHLWHWLSGGASLSVVLFFAATGFLLNHPQLIASHVTVQEISATVPRPLIPVVEGAATTGTGPLPFDLAAWLGDLAGEPMRGRLADYSGSEIWVDLPRPGGEGTIWIDRVSGAVQVEITRQGWLAVAADLHKGREASPAWTLVIDLLALGSVAFALSGVALMVLHARARPATWPVTAGGLALPLILFLLFTHV